ncbi:site-specific integrase [Lutimonas saemankumensis]|uniref:phage integrase SAM-like domain-containing protein n=1 Tax=Lutimonas saemankumensis TaxID=483016 RepID=UPI001CD68923|nr:phage integrase SAM-like domain-containing protein [Lutimonas saemankumensis]MCA0933090.1 site-specific integrase [Lutimonas saemankumensis]
MATVNFLYRSKREMAPLTVRLLYRWNEKDYVFGHKTRLFISKTYWNKDHKNKRPRDIDLINEQKKINKELNRIENHILLNFSETDPNYLSKQWFAAIIDKYYNPPNKKRFPKDLIKYIDYYRDIKKNDVTPSSLKKFNVTKHKLERFETHRRKVIMIKDVDLLFINEFENYCLDLNYAKNTIARDIRFIKSVCNHAKDNGLETSSQLRKIKGKYVKVDSIYLNNNDIEAIENVKELPNHLDNARDWLLISCYTGQRVSDFMRFQKEMIRYEVNQKKESKPLLEFTQHKTGKVMTIPLMDSVMAILDKRGGEFPHSISDQNYNVYIKDVCRLAGIDELVNGSRKEETYSGSGIYRKQEGDYKKYELVTSHIGRRSFATNYYGKIPTSFLIYVTGHSTESMFLNYIGKSNKDIALELTNYF